MRWRAPKKVVISPYKGVQQKGPEKWISRTRDPFTKRQIWLGTFKSADEAHQAVVAKKIEFQSRAAAVSDQNNASGGVVQSQKLLKKLRVVCFDPDDSTDCFPGGEENDEESNHQSDVEEVIAGEDPAKKRRRKPNNPYKGIYHKGKRWVSEIRDPITKHRFWLGTFDTAEEALQAHVAKKLEIESGAVAASDQNSASAEVDRSQKTTRTPRVICPDPDDVTPCFSGKMKKKESIHQNVVELKDVISCEDSGKMWCRAPNKGIARNPYKGAYRKGRKWVSEIRDPIAKCRVRLGSFNSAEEAHQAYVAKKLEFESRAVAVAVSVSDQNTPPPPSPTPKTKIHLRPSPVPRTESYLSPPISPYKGVHFNGKKWTSRIRDPPNKCQIWLGTFNSAEEAHQAYVEKKLEIERRSTAVSDRNSAPADSSGSSELESKDSISETGGSSEAADEERLPLKQILQISANQELNSGGLMEIGAHIIDQNGFLLGEFSRLDDDLRIWDTEKEDNWSLLKSTEKADKNGA